MDNYMRFVRDRYVWCAIFLGLVVPWALSSGVAPTLADSAKPKKVELTPEQKAEVRAVRQVFNSAGKNPEKQEKAIEMAVAAGPHAAAPLVRVVEARFKGALKKYKKSVGKAAKKLGNDRLITSADELVGRDKKLIKSRDQLEKMSAMHARLVEVVERGAPALTGEADAPAETADPAAATTAGSPTEAKEKATEEPKPALFDQVPMIEYVALGIGAPGMSQREIDCVLWTNRTRAKHGLRLLWADPKLSNSARMHSKDMVEHDFRAHESPLPGKKTFRDRGKIHDTRADGENIAEAPFTGEKIVEYWLDSPPHKANIMHPKFRRIGVGLHNDVWTQVFGGIDSFEQ